MRLNSRGMCVQRDPNLAAKPHSLQLLLLAFCLPLSPLHERARCCRTSDSMVILLLQQQAVRHGGVALHILLFLHTFFWRHAPEQSRAPTVLLGSEMSLYVIGRVRQGDCTRPSVDARNPKPFCAFSFVYKYTEYWVVFLFFCFFPLPRFRRGRSWFISFFRDQQSLCPETMNSG